MLLIIPPCFSSRPPSFLSVVDGKGGSDDAEELEDDLVVSFSVSFSLSFSADRVDLVVGRLRSEGDDMICE